MTGPFRHRAGISPFRRKILTFLAPLFFFGTIALCIAAARIVDSLLGLNGLFPAPWNLRLARPFMLGGLLLMIWSASFFFRAHGTPVPFNPPKKLVTKGPFAYSRNPMMIGLFLVLFGLGLRLGSVTLLFVVLPVLFLAIRFMLIKVEEPELEQRFGEAYREYQRRTPRFLFFNPSRRTGLK